MGYSTLKFESTYREGLVQSKRGQLLCSIYPSLLHMSYSYPINSLQKSGYKHEIRSYGCIYDHVHMATKGRGTLYFPINMKNLSVGCHSIPLYPGAVQDKSFDTCGAHCIKEHAYISYTA